MVESPNSRVLQRHLRALQDGDIDATLDTYTTGAVLVSGGAVGRGHDYIRTVLQATAEQGLALDPDINALEEGDVTFLSWRARQEGHQNIVGSETFVFEAGLIAVHTVFIVALSGQEPKGLGSAPTSTAD